MNPIIEKVKAAVLQKADPRLVPVVNKLADAGKKIMYSQQTRGMLMKQLGKGDDPELIGEGVAKLVGIVYNESKKTAPMQALIPASVLMLCEGLTFLEDAGAVKVDNDFLSNCMLAMGSAIAQLFGATQDKLQGVFDKGGAQQAAAPPTPPTPPAPPPGIMAGAAQGAM